MNIRTLTSFMGLRGIFDCLIVRPLSPIFFTDIRVLNFFVSDLTGETQRNLSIKLEERSQLQIPECIAVRNITELCG